MIDLKSILIIYNDGVKTNAFTKEGGAAALELAVALSYKISKHCKRCTIQKKPYSSELKIVVIFDASIHGGACRTIFKYEYLFTGDALRSLSIGL